MGMSVNCLYQEQHPNQNQIEVSDWRRKNFFHNKKGDPKVPLELYP